MNLQALKDELTADPLGYGYSAMGDVDAAKRINQTDRPGDGQVTQLVNYLATNRNRRNTGSDTVATAMLGRLMIVANAAVGSDPFGSTVVITLDMKCSALALLEICRNPNITSAPFASNTMKQLLADMVSAEVMKAADRQAIIALSDNHQSRAGELGFVGVTESDIADARRLL